MYYHVYVIIYLLNERQNAHGFALNFILHYDNSYHLVSSVCSLSLSLSPLLCALPDFDGICKLRAVFVIGAPLG